MILNATTILLPQDLDVGDSPTFAELTLTGLTEGSVLFSGPGGLISEDNSNLFWNDSTNRLGILTNSPNVALDVRGGVDIGLDGTKLRFGASQNASIEYDSGNDALLFDLTGTTNANFSTTGNSNALYIDTNGNVGVGTDTPADPFHIYGSVNGNFVTRVENINNGNSATTAMDARNDQGDGLLFGITSSGYATYGALIARAGFVYSDRILVFGSDSAAGEVRFGVGGSIPTRVAINSTHIEIPNDNYKLQLGATLTDLEIYSDGTDGRIDTNGLLKINSATEIASKTKMTAIGGFAIKLTNKTGAVTIQGQLVKADTANNDAIILTAAGDTECIGVFLDAGVADDSEAWVVIAGIADVAMEDNTAATRGNWVETSNAEAGYANATAGSPAAAPGHFEEIGHCIETVAAGGGGTHILARCVIHFL